MVHERGMKNVGTKLELFRWSMGMDTSVRIYDYLTRNPRSKFCVPGSFLFLGPHVPLR
jgi:hypothetical protein